MKNPLFIKRIQNCCLFLFTLLGTLNAQNTSTKPNIVLILADDLGYGDLSSFGQKNWQTPNID
jgi:arylsulfatase A